MTLIRFTTAAVARSRFALSPLAETLAALLGLDRGYADAWLVPWVRSHRPEYVRWRDADPVRRGILRLTSTTKWFPEVFSVVPQDGMSTRVEAELEVVRGHRDADVRADLALSAAASWAGHDLSWVSAEGLAETFSDTVFEGWQRFVEPDWRRRRTLLERDVMHRAGLLAAYGWREATSGMLRSKGWVERDALEFSGQTFDDVQVGDDGLVFVPHTMGRGSRAFVQGHRCALVYPAWGVGTPTDDAADAATALLGSGRSAVLHTLASPATPTQLADLLDVSLGTVSGHLQVLREAGVVHGVRTGRTVRYTLTTRGHRLLETLGG